MPLRPLPLFLAGIAALSDAPFAGAQTPAPAAPAGPAASEPADSPTVLEEVDVIGQAPPGAILGDIPPENSLDQRDIRSYGVSTVAELLDEIALQTESGQSREGGGPVILVNGRRVSGVNEVSDLPTEAILRLDILPEEVAIKYGYSAEQKVVNVILRRRFAAVTGEGTAGESTEGGAERVRGDATVTRIRDNRRLNVAFAAQTQSSLTEADRDIVPANADPASDPEYRTLQPSRENYSANVVYAMPLGNSTTASTNVSATHSESRSLNGLSAVTGAPLAQTSQNTALHAGGSLNRDIPQSWRLSVIGAFDHAVGRNDNQRIGNLSTGAVSLDMARSVSDSGNASVLATRKVFALPAGNLQLSLQGGAQATSTTSEATGSRSRPRQTISRSSGNAQVSVDVPITKRNGWGGSIGSLTANANTAATFISDFDTLKTVGYGVNWSPVTKLSVIAGVSQDRRAPSVQQLLNPTTVGFNTSVYDYLTGESVLVTSTTGGNPLLAADDRRTVKLSATFKPFANRNFTMTGNYSDSRTKNAIIGLPGVSPLIETAFPDRFIRDEDGTLLSYDVRPINVAAQERSSLRWGFNLTQVLRAPTRPQFGNQFRPPRAQSQQQRSAPARSANAEGGASSPPPDAPPRARGDGENSVDEVVVAGQRPPDEDGPPTRERRGFRERGEFGGPPGGAFGEGGPPGGGPGFGGGPGGPGGSGGPGGFGRGGGFGGGGGDNGSRLQLSVFHTWLIRSEVTLREGLAPIDLLDGGNLGASPPARHQVQMNGGITDNGLGVRLSGQWRSSSGVNDATSAMNGLHFGALTTLDLRLFADLGQKFPMKPWARGLRTTLTVQNVFNERQHVTDASGAVPFAYQAGRLDPVGRVVLLSARKIL
ncbi:MAG: TonB-dependent receptor [Steroidobacteraceae bacterium]